MPQEEARLSTTPRLIEQSSGIKASNSITSIISTPEADLSGVPLATRNLHLRSDSGDQPRGKASY